MLLPIFTQSQRAEYSILFQDKQNKWHFYLFAFRSQIEI